MARQSLRKASSAKRPMSVADFHSLSLSSRAPTLTETLGLHEVERSSNWLDSSRRLLHGIRRWTSPFPSSRDSGKVYVAGLNEHHAPRTGLSCLGSKSCSLSQCVSKETSSADFLSVRKPDSVQLIGVRTNSDDASIPPPHLSWNSSFDSCSPTFASFSHETISSGPVVELPLAQPCPSDHIDSSGIATGSSTDLSLYASVVEDEASSQPVAERQRRRYIFSTVFDFAKMHLSGPFSGLLFTCLLGNVYTPIQK
ncbi:unnamed protein product [Echinostoma caproni]|uniref:Uncharacterized protein n=1 Tax=Echinostoma caproni TaxID=27848 RepID=A0A183AKZ0_9TREM|nr:unnamed protein product [Echinostoma caproni]